MIYTDAAWYSSARYVKRTRGQVSGDGRRIPLASLSVVTDTLWCSMLTRVCAKGVRHVQNHKG